ARAVTNIQKKRIPPPASKYARGRAFCPPPADNETARTGPAGLAQPSHRLPPERRAGAAPSGGASRAWRAGTAPSGGAARAWEVGARAARPPRFPRPGGGGGAAGATAGGGARGVVRVVELPGPRSSS